MSDLSQQAASGHWLPPSPDQIGALLQNLSDGQANHGLTVDQIRSPLGEGIFTLLGGAAQTGTALLGGGVAHPGLLLLLRLVLQFLSALLTVQTPDGQQPAG